MMAKTGCSFCSNTTTERLLKCNKNSDLTMARVPKAPPNKAMSRK